jgi:hypothetical protein
MEARSGYLPLLLLLALPAGFPGGSRGAQQAETIAPLTIEEVLRLSRSGFSEELIVTRIKKNGKPFNLNTDELLELKKAGLGENIIKFLLDPSQPYTPQPPAPEPKDPPSVPVGAPTPAKEYPPDDYASRVPREPGLYTFAGDGAQRIDLKLLLGVVEGPGLGKFFMKKGKTIAYLAGAAAKARFSDPNPVFYLRPPEGGKIQEIVLIAMNRKDRRREIEMGAAGEKQELQPDDIRSFESVEVAQGLFRIVTAPLSKGEYLFFFIGSPAPDKGTYGKGHDFGIDEASR